MKDSAPSFAENPGELLVVDDDAISLKALGDILKKHGFSVRRASDASSALAMIDTKLPEIILLDILMPDVDGFELCRQLKKKSKTKDIPVLFISLLNETRHKVKGFEVGGIDFISKPFHEEEVLARVRNHLTLYRLREDLEKKNALLQKPLAELERRVSERTAELKESNEQLSKFSSVIGQTTEHVIITNREGVIEYVNPSFEQGTGYSLAETKGKTTRILKSGEQSQVFYQKLWNTILSGAPFRAEFVNRKKNGDLYYEEKIVAALKNDQGEITNFVSIGRDISTRLKMEEQLRQLQKLESVGRLACGVAHDFNNILTSVRLSSEALMEEDLEEAERIQVAKEITQSVDRGSSLTDQMLAFGREQKVSLQPLDLGMLLERMVKVLSRLVKADIAIEVEAADSLPPINADQGMIEQVILNLTLNARDAMNESGKLRFVMESVEVKPEEITFLPEAMAGNFVRMTVSDTGAGIPIEVMPHLFEPFFTTKEPGKGTGLGLSMVYGIVKQHEGWIQVESKLGEGTTFQLFFPVSKDIPQLQTDGVISNNLCERTEVILLVEDDRLVRETLTKFLERNGYHVLEAESGSEALDIWKMEKDRIKLLFTDMRMPGGMTGAELARRLLAEKPKLKVIINSGYSDELESGYFDPQASVVLLPKPCPPRKISQAVRNTLDAK